MNMPVTGGNKRTLRDWISSLPVTLVLLLAVFVASGEIIDSQMLRVGQNTWNNYFVLRNADGIHQPDCNPNVDVDTQVQATLQRMQAQAAADPLNSILGDQTNAQDVRKSLLQTRDQCRQTWQDYQLVKQHLTPGVKIYSGVERAVAAAVSLTGSYNRLLLCLLILLCAATATATREHFAIRGARTYRDHYLSTGVQLVANLMLLVSALAYRKVDLVAMQGGVPASFFYLHALWITGFAVMSAITLYQLIRPPRMEAGGSWANAGFCVPLYTYLCLVSGGWFFLHGFWAGIGVYTDTMMELTTELMSLALYVWVGMLLKQTRFADLMFDIFRPWDLSPELLCFMVMMVSAVLTAYTGASGAYVMAAGATIYYELVRAGARKPFALAASAMSGSLGVVLAPCLLIVIIAAIDNSVTTTELFASGFKVFVLTSLLFLAVTQLSARSPIHIASPVKALPASLRAMLPLLPYVLIFALIVGFFHFVLQRGLDEFSAPVILPLLMLALLAYEAKLEPRVRKWLAWLERPTESGPDRSLERRLRIATADTTSNIGGLLMLVALSVSLGGIVERSGIMDRLPAHLPSIWGMPPEWVAMSLIVPILIVVGMLMDPYGAIILVNSAVAKIAYDNGIGPIHFWIIVLVSFELGYLTPPVALNHLLARSVIGDDEVDAHSAGETNLWRRYESYLLPITVMLAALLIIAYLPLISPAMDHWLFQRIAVPN